MHFARLAGPSGFARTVAIKRAHPHLARDREFALMFMDEARVAARVHHPNVVPMLDVLETPEDLVLVMEYVHGESVARLFLAAKEKGERVPPPVAASIIIDTLHGLHAAHEAKNEQGAHLAIVHRDVSPQNILVGVDGISRLVDFGIAKAAGRLHVTSDNSVKGKYAYMAPEQVRGLPVSRLTDTYAPAVVVLEQLNGEPHIWGASEPETIQKSLTSVVRPPSEIVSGLDPRLDAVLAKGLARDPELRYATARDMALDIEACMAAIRPSEIGSWVARMAGEQLAFRAAVLADMEREDSNARAAPAFVPPDPNGLSLSSSAIEVGPTGLTGTGSRKGPIWITAAVGALLVLFVVAFVLRGSRADDRARDGQNSAPASNAPSATQLAPPFTAPADPTQADFAPVVPSFPITKGSVPWAGAANGGGGASEAAPSGTGQAASPGPGPSPAAGGGAAPSPGRAPAPAKAPHGRHAAANCEPPYIVDPQGRTIFRKECL